MDKDFIVYMKETDEVKLKDCVQDKYYLHFLLNHLDDDYLIENGDKRKEYLTELGICLAKHRIAYKIYNFHSEPVGAEYKISQK